VNPAKHALFNGLALTIGLLAAAALAAAYYTWRAYADPFPHLPVRVAGDFPLAADTELGFTGRIDGRTHWLDPRSQLDFHLYTDRRVARVDAPGQQAPGRVQLMTVGGSFAFGYGVENGQTFTAVLGREIGVTVANVAYPSHGTVQALQVWRRNRDRHPRDVIYAIIDDHLRRNLSPCAPSITAYCLPVSHIAFDASQRPSIAPPDMGRSMPADLRSRFLTDVVFSDRIGVADVLWKARMDLHRVATLSSFRYDDTPERRQIAMSFLLDTMAAEINAAGGRLLVVYIPETNRRGTLLPPSAALLAAVAGKPLSFLDLTPEMAKYREVAGRPPLFIPGNWHPSPAGHRLIAEAIRRTWFANPSGAPEPEAAVQKSGGSK
jgi:hypothetical protein